MELAKAVEAAEAIPGWMSHEELTWLGGQAAEHHTIFEVGSWQGRSTKVMALMTPGVVYAVDDLSGETSDPVDNQAMLFGKHLAPELESGKVSVIRRPSLIAAANLQNDFADMVFIDGDHTYPAPRFDIQTWRWILRKGGLLCGHDRWLPGVEQSLVEVFEQGVDDAAGSIWVAP
jgi:predicted O-methyltransferase YrrM